MGKKDPRVDAYIDKAAPFAQPILKTIRDAVHAGCPDVEETIKWSMPFFDHHGIVCHMSAFKAHCTMRFWNPAASARGENDRLARITSLDELPPKKALVSMVREAAKLNEAGVKPARPKRAAKPALDTPDDLTKALAKNKKAKAAFDAFPPSHKREYIEWIVGAKAEETRARRIAQAVEWIGEGKSRNWKYERKSS